MKNVLKYLLALLLLGGSWQLSAQGSRVSVVLTDMPAREKWYVEGFPVSPMVKGDIKDSLIVESGSFSYILPSDTVYHLYLYPGSAIKWCRGNQYTDFMNVIDVFTGNGASLEITGRMKDGYLDYHVKGTPLNDVYSELQNTYRRENAGMIQEIYRELSVTDMNDSIRNSQLFQRMNDIYQAKADEQRKYRLANPDSEVSAFYLTEEDDSVLIADVDRLSPAVRGGIFKEILEQRCKEIRYHQSLDQNKKNVQPQMDAPDFRFIDMKGEEITLDKYAGSKYVVLDFWGTWCVWCLRGVPAMRDYYQKYNDKVEFIGVDCNDTEEKWREVVAAKQMDWVHIRNSDKPDEDLTLKYAVHGYPTKVIIDPNGKIAGYFEGESEDFYSALDALFKSE